MRVGRAADLTLDEQRFIAESVARRAEEEQRYELLYRRSLARTLAAAAERAPDPMLALRLAVAALDRSPDVGSELVRACLRRAGAPEVEPVPPDEDDLSARARAAARLRVYSGAHSSRWRSPSAPQPWADLARYVPLPWRDQIVSAAWAAEARSGSLVADDGLAIVVQQAETAEVIGSRAIGRHVTSVAISPAGDLLALGCEDDLIRVVRAAGELEPVAELHWRGFVSDLDIDGPGRLVAAVTLAGAVAVWDLVTQQLQCSAAAETDAGIVAVTGSADHVLVGSGRLPLSAAALADFAGRAAGRGLTAEEWQTWVGMDPDGNPGLVTPSS